MSAVPRNFQYDEVPVPPWALGGQVQDDGTYDGPEQQFGRNGRVRMVPSWEPPCVIDGEHRPAQVSVWIGVEGDGKEMYFPLELGQARMLAIRLLQTCNEISGLPDPFPIRHLAPVGGAIHTTDGTPVTAPGYRPLPDSTEAQS